MAQKVHDLVFVPAGTPGLDLTWSSSEGVMMMMMMMTTCIDQDVDQATCISRIYSADCNIETSRIAPGVRSTLNLVMYYRAC